MKIAINALSAKTGGGATYLRGLIPRLAELGKEHEYYVFIPRGVDRLRIRHLGHSNIRAIEIRTPNLIIRLLAEQLLLPLLLWKYDLDILYSPGSMTSILAPRKVVLLIQSIDMYKQITGRPLLQSAKLKILNILSRLSLRKASTVIFLSNYARKLILQSASMENTKRNSVVIYLGVDIRESLGKHPKGPILSDKGNCLLEETEYMLSVSNIGEHKNYEVLIRAYNLLSTTLKSRYQLIIIGDTQLRRSYYKKLVTLVEEYSLEEKITFLGKVSYPKMREFYQRASLFVLPSLLENFSFTILEAMASGVPVIAANSTAIPEEVGDAGITFDPTSPDKLAENITGVLQSKDLRDEMIKKGLARARNFSWDDTARKTLAVFEEVYRSR